MLYGKYVEDGTINLETTLGELGIDDIGVLLPIEKKATIHHLIQARPPGEVRSPAAIISITTGILM